MSTPNKFHCDVCTSDCTNRVRIACAECENYDLCVLCFSKGAHTGKHKPYHPYRIIETNSYPILCDDWGADEELSLIKGCQTLGLGNWQDVADFIGHRTKEEVYEHYTKYYLDSKFYPIPDITKPQSQFRITQDEFLTRRRERIEDFSKLPLPQPRKPISSVPSCHEVQGFMPGRLDFETEFENEAENPVKDMTFEENDSKLNVELKLTVLDIYGSRLTSRAEKKKLIFQNNLMEYRKLIAIDKKRSKDVKDLYNKLKAYARVMNPQDFQNFSTDMMAEVNCRNRIHQLQEWRKNGLTTLEQGVKYEKDKQQRILTLERFGGDLDMIVTGSRHQQRSTPLPMADTPDSHSATTTTPTASTTTAATTAASNTFANQNANEVKRMTTISDIQHAADYSLLSIDEQQVCLQLKVVPKTYIVIKELLFRELLNKGGLMTSKECVDLLHIDTMKAIKVYDFFCSQGWIKPLA